jgi:hypothetical protein
VGGSSRLYYLRTPGIFFLFPFFKYACPLVSNMCHQRQMSYVRGLYFCVTTRGLRRNAVGCNTFDRDYEPM